jgi:hypothetical protein
MPNLGPRSGGVVTLPERWTLNLIAHDTANEQSAVVAYDPT